MANIPKLQEFASQNGFGLTSPLTHDQVVALAEHWFPRMFFYEKEKFHPISLEENFTMIDDLFQTLPASAQQAFLVSAITRGSGAIGVTRTFEPPVVLVPDGLVFLPGGQSVPRAAKRMIREGTSAREGLADPDVGSDAIVTHGASFTRSHQFFGGTATIAGGAEASPGDPFLPRARGADDRPQITVMASLLNLFELLKYELLVTTDDDYPPDALRGAVEIAASLVVPVGAPTPLAFATLRQFLFDMIEAHETNGPLPAPPLGWRLNRSAWNAVTRFTFLEYDFFYAFNDFNRYQDALFANEHEGDNEGCCLVFDRSLFTVAPNDPVALLRVIPHSMITSVHEEFQDADHFKFVDPPLSFPPELRGRDVVPFAVFIAGGSHATYLTSGSHDLVDFQDHVAQVEEHLLAAILLSPIVVPLLIISLIIEHFTDTEDITSEDGIQTGPEDVVGGQPTAVGNRLVVMPMSADNHIYQPANEELLRLRAYAGLWGAHNGLIDHSPVFQTKTGRYFRKLISQM